MKHLPRSIGNGGDLFPLIRLAGDRPEHMFAEKRNPAALGNVRLVHANPGNTVSIKISTPIFLFLILSIAVQLSFSPQHANTENPSGLNPASEMNHHVSQKCRNTRIPIPLCCRPKLRHCRARQHTIYTLRQAGHCRKLYGAFPRPPNRYPIPRADSESVWIPARQISNRYSEIQPGVCRE